MIQQCRLVAFVEFLALVEMVAEFAFALVAVFHYVEQSVVEVPKAMTARPARPSTEAVMVQLLQASQPPKKVEM